MKQRSTAEGKPIDKIIMGIGILFGHRTLFPWNTKKKIEN